MFSNLNKNKSYNVEYFEINRIQTDHSFALYVRGQSEEAQPYCVQAKRRLFASLIYVKQYLQKEDLVAIYCDVMEDSNNSFPGFRLLISDIRNGLFNKVLIWDLESILGIDKMHNQLIELTKCEEKLEFFDLKGNLFQSDALPINQLLGV